MSGGQTDSSRALRVAVADDAVLLREGIGQILRAGGMDVVVSVDTAEELLGGVHRRHDLRAARAQDLPDPLAEQHSVIGDCHPERTGTRVVSPDHALTLAGCESPHRSVPPW